MENQNPNQLNDDSFKTTDDTISKLNSKTISSKTDKTLINNIQHDIINDIITDVGKYYYLKEVILTSIKNDKGKTELLQILNNHQKRLIRDFGKLNIDNKLFILNSYRAYEKLVNIFLQELDVTDTLHYFLSLKKPRDGIQHYIKIDLIYNHKTYTGYLVNLKDPRYAHDMQIRKHKVEIRVWYFKLVAGMCTATIFSALILKLIPGLDHNVLTESFFELLGSVSEILKIIIGV